MAKSRTVKPDGSVTRKPTMFQTIRSDGRRHGGETVHLRRSDVVAPHHTRRTPRHQRSGPLGQESRLARSDRRRQREHRARPQQLI